MNKVTRSKISVKSKKTLIPIESQFAEVSVMIRSARRAAFRSVNASLVDLYWELGCYISRRVELSEWGSAVVSQLAVYLQREHPDMRGLSDKNLWRMKQFYETYREQEKLSAAMRELTWSNNILILSKARSSEEREFYIRLCVRENYSARELERQIKSGLFERSLRPGAKLSTALREMHPRAEEVFRDAYALDFLGLSDGHSEGDLRKAIVRDLKRFILEFGRDFAFVGEEYRVQAGLKDYFLDLLFYHRELRCLVAFELKIDEFKPEYLGKLSFYLEALDRDVKKPHESPSIGIILCKGKDDEVVEYAMSRTLSPAVVAEYRTKLPDKRMLQDKLHEFFNLSVRELRADYEAKPK